MDVFRLIDELEQLVEQGAMHVFGKVFIDEQAFFVATAKLKKALPAELIKAERSLRENQAASPGQTQIAHLDTIRLIDELEKLADNGTAHVFGKVFIDEQAFFVTTAKLKRALADDVAKAQAMAAAPNQTPDVAGEAERAAQRLLDDARGQAAQIIEEARREAERIVADARVADARVADARQGDAGRDAAGIGYSQTDAGQQDGGAWQPPDSHSDSPWSDSSTRLDN